MSAPGVRIIAGIARGRRLQVPSGVVVRPTKDRVKAAIFSALDARGLLADALVLDLYAGSGALGLEAVSRGAAGATLVERHPEAIAAIRSNVATCGFESLVRVEARDVERFVASCTSTFDLVFVDPPYEFGDDLVEQMLRSVADLAPGGTLVVERPSRPRRARGAAPEPSERGHVRTDGPMDGPTGGPTGGPAGWPMGWPMGWTESWRRSFGDTLVVFWTPTTR